MRIEHMKIQAESTHVNLRGLVQMRCSAAAALLPRSAVYLPPAELQWVGL